MRKQSVIPVPFSFLLFCLLSLVSILSSFDVHSQVSFTTQPTSSKLHVAHLTTDEDMMLIAVRYFNPEQLKLKLAIYDGEGQLLFRDVFSVTQFDKKFKVPAEQSNLRFVLELPNDKIYDSFHLDYSSKDEKPLLVNRN